MPHCAQGLMSLLIPLSSFTLSTTAQGTTKLSECWQIAGACPMRFGYESACNIVHIGALRGNSGIRCYFGVKKTFDNENFLFPF